MKEIICNSVYFGVTISILSYILGVQLKKKFGWGLLNPLLVSIVLVISFLLILKSILKPMIRVPNILVIF